MSAPDEATGSRGEVEALAAALFAEWRRVDPDSGVAKYPPSYMANFADMARAALASDWLAQRDAAQHAEGAKAVLDAVEGVANLLGYSYDSAQYVAAARHAAAWFGVTR
jgi:hypothetical protein